MRISQLREISYRSGRSLDRRSHIVSQILGALEGALDTNNLKFSRGELAGRFASYLGGSKFTFMAG